MATTQLNVPDEESIERPLRNMSDDELEEDVKRFAQQIGLEGEEVVELGRGARVARYPNQYELAAQYDEDGPNARALPVTLKSIERIAIRNEKKSPFMQSRDMILTVITCATGALVQGWDQTGELPMKLCLISNVHNAEGEGSNAANLTWPGEFGLGGSLDGQSAASKWKIGLVNAAPYLAAAFIGCWLTDPINSRFGRRGTIFFAALWCFASVIGAACTNDWKALLATRICLGIGMGAKASTIPIFAAEAAPSFFRGTILLSWQLWVAVGIFLGFTANLIVFGANDSLSWRLQLGSALIPAIPLMILIYIVPESPRWYMKRRGRKDYLNSLESLKRLRRTPLQAYRDFYFMHKQLEIERIITQRETAGPLPIHETLRRESVSPTPPTSGLHRFTELFTVPRNRRATIAAMTIMLVQQLCGINILAFYSGTLFSHATDKKRALLFSWGFGLINALFALPAYKNIDRFGRRPLALFSTANMAWTLLGGALGFLIDGKTHGSARIGIVAFFLFLFAAFYSPGIGPVPFTYSSECFPLANREVGMALSVATNLFFAGVLTLVYPRLDAVLKPTGALGLFAGFNVISFFIIFLFMPETARKTLEDLTRVFCGKTRVHVKHQVTEVAPKFLGCLRQRRNPSNGAELGDGSSVEPDVMINPPEMVARAPFNDPFRPSE